MTALGTSAAMRRDPALAALLAASPRLFDGRTIEDDERARIVALLGPQSSAQRPAQVAAAPRRVETAQRLREIARRRVSRRSIGRVVLGPGDPGFDPAAAKPGSSARVIAGRIAVGRGATLALLRGRGGGKPLGLVRQEAMYWVWRLSPLSLGQIGLLFGDRDHTTILHGVRRHAALAGLPLVRAHAAQEGPER